MHKRRRHGCRFDGQIAAGPESIFCSPGARSLAESLYVETKKTEDSLTDFVAAAFRAGDEFQRGMVGLLYRMGTLGAGGRDYWVNLFQQFACQGDDHCLARPSTCVERPRAVPLRERAILLEQ